MFGLDEKIGKYFREEQRASRLGEKAAAVLTLPHKCQCHMRDQHCWLEYLVAPLTDSFYLQGLEIFFNLDSYTTLKSPNEWMNCLILALCIQDTKKEMSSLF